MDPNRTGKGTTRREILQATTALTGGMLLARLFPGALVSAAAPGYPQQAGAAPADPVAAMRAQFASAPLESHKLTDTLTLLSGPGGNVVVLNGPDGKLVVDTFVSPAWPRLKQSLEDLGNAPLKFVMDTHWHFDHADNNAPLHAAGATVIAHENTPKRMSESHTLQVLGLHFDPSPANALPQRTFKDSMQMKFSGEDLALGHIPPSHTDSDIFIHFRKANVLHLGDTFFNGMYPYIDGGTGGSIGGMIAAADKTLAMADNDTKIVPGHGPLGNKADLAKFRDMLSTVRDRVQKLHSSGKSVEEAVAAKPLADLDPVWGKALFNGDAFVRIVYTAF
jgi:cyclase